MSSCINCNEEVHSGLPFCTRHGPPSRLQRIEGSKSAAGFYGPNQAENYLAQHRTPSALRRVVIWMRKSGYHNWAEHSLRRETFLALKVTVISEANSRICIMLHKSTEAFHRQLRESADFQYEMSSGMHRYTIPWNSWPAVRGLVMSTYPVSVLGDHIKSWMPRATKESSNPKTMKMLADGTYSAELGFSRGKIVGGRYVATEHGTAEFKNMFDGASAHPQKMGNFGRRHVAPATIENLNKLISLCEQPLEVKIEACSIIVEQSERDAALASSFPWRMSTKKYKKEGLHKYVVDTKSDPYSVFDIEEPNDETEEWNKWLNLMQPYSQQKIMAAASIKARYVGWWVDMRVGKTPAAMMLMRKLIHDNEVDHFVVVAPAINVYDPWYTELEKQGCFKVCVLDEGQAIDEQSIKSEAYDVYVISYSSLSARLPIMQWFWSMERVGWTFDETSLVKNPKSKRAKACRFATEHAPYVFALNGTPLAQGPQDIWSQQIIVDQGVTFGTSFERFCSRWLAKAGPGKYSVDPSVSTLFELMLAGSSIRYLRSEADQFSGRDKNFRYIAMPPTREMKESTNEILKGFTRDELNTERAVKECILTIYGHLRECCAGYNKYEVVEGSGEYNRVRHKMNSKLVWIRTFLKGNPGQPMIIFSENSEMEDMIMEMLTSEGISFAFMRPHGSSSPLTGPKRMDQIRKFQEGEARVILMKSTQAKGVTLNRIPAVKAGLGSYPVIVYTQPTWSLIDWEQSQDRAVGTDPVSKKSISTMVYVLVVRGSIEQKIVGALRRKKKVAETLLADSSRNGYENPFESMDLSEPDDMDIDELFDAHEMQARYLLGLAPQKKLSERMIRKADIKYRATKYRTTQKVQEGRPLSEAALYLLEKFKPPTATIGEFKDERIASAK